MVKMKKDKKHLWRRCFLFWFSIVFGVMVSLIICRQITKIHFVIDAINMIDVSKVMIGVWGTLLGFIITAESILIAFSNGSFTQEFKKTGHYMTVIFQYTQTSVKLLVYILVFVCIIVINAFDLFQMFLFICFSLMTFIDVFISFIILVLMLRMADS